MCASKLEKSAEASTDGKCIAGVVQVVEALEALDFAATISASKVMSKKKKNTFDIIDEEKTVNKGAGAG